MTRDVLVIGGGPAGLATAISARLAGLSVEVLEPQFGLSCSDTIDKCCGEGLLPASVAALGRLGIGAAVLASAGAPLHGISFFTECRSASAAFAGNAFGVRRTALHRLLMERARTVGVLLRADAGRLIMPGVVMAGGEQVRARWIVGADGAQSAVRRSAGLEAGIARSRRFALRRHFELRPGMQMPDGVEVHWVPEAQAYVTPVGLGQVGIAVLSRGRFAGMEAALESFPALGGMVRGAKSFSRPRGAMTAHRRLQAVQAGNVALVGDASGGVDAITGDGLSLSFHQGLALGEALATGELGAYERAHARLLRRARLMSRVLMAVGDFDGLRNALMPLLACPGVFSTLLRFHVHMPIAAREQGKSPFASRTSLVPPWAP